MKNQNEESKRRIETKNQNENSERKFRTMNQNDESERRINKHKQSCMIIKEWQSRIQKWPAALMDEYV